MPCITIHTTTMGYRVGVSAQGVIIGSHLTIHEHIRALTHRQWDNQNHRYVIAAEYYYYDKTQQLCYFPKFDLDRFIAYLKHNHVDYNLVDLPAEQGKAANFHMLSFVEYKNDKQKNAVQFLTDDQGGPVRALALQTGAGKTVSFIWSLQKRGVRSLITMTSRLEQWVGELLKYTTLDEDDIFVIQGVGSLTKLFSQIDNGISPKVILGSAKTIRNYIDYGGSYQHLPHPSELCEKLGIGIIGTDEYHEHYYTNFLIGTVFNPALFIPITATFIANDPFVRNIFDQSIPKAIQFVGGEYDRYVNVYAYTYQRGRFDIKPFHYTGPKGYSQIKFEKYLLGRGRKLLDDVIDAAILPIIRQHYIDIADKGEKFLLLCATTDLCDHFAGIFKRLFKDKTVSVFYSGMPVTVLENYDIILSTPGSSGCLTGDSIVSISRNGTNSNSGSYSCTLKNAYLHFNQLAKKRAYNWNREIPTYIRSYDGTSIRLCEVGDIIYSGVKDVYKVTLDNGLFIKCTSDHPILTINGWVQAKDVVGKDVLCEVTKKAISGNGRKRFRDLCIDVSMNHPYAARFTKSSKGRRYFQWKLEIHRAIYEAVVLNKMTLREYREALKNIDTVKTMQFVDPAIYDIHHKDYNHSNNDPNNLVALERVEHKKLHSETTTFNFNQGIPNYSKATSIEYIGQEDTYDIHCLDQSHNFVANGIVVHNTGRDIKNLRTCLAFENTASEIRNLQFIGRLRAYPAVKNTPEFVYLAFSCIPKHIEYHNKRALLYGNRALSLKHRTI